jgi:NAD(P) transhydrogenase
VARSSAHRASGRGGQHWNSGQGHARDRALPLGPGRDLHGIRLSYDGTITVDAFMRRGRVVRDALSEWVGTNLDRHHVDVYRGVASFVDAHTVRVADEDTQISLHGRSSPSPRVAADPSRDDSVRRPACLRLRHHPRDDRSPRSLTIIGGGTIGCEYACLFKVLGLDHVRVINAGDRLLPFADAEVANMLQEAMESIGVQLLMPQHVAEVDGRDVPVVVLQDGRRLEAEAVLVALGRRSNVEGLGLDRAGVRLNEHRQLEVNERFRRTCCTFMSPVT